MATTEEIQLFKTLTDKGMSQDEAKKFIQKGRETTQGLQPAFERLGITTTVDTPEGAVQETVEVETEPVEPETEEGVTGFVSETGEALAERGEKLGEIKERFDTKIEEGQKSVKAKFQEGGLGPAFAESLKVSANKLGSSLQAAGQVVGAGGDIVWEGLENIIQEVTPESAEKVIEGAVKSIGESDVVGSIAESYTKFRERNPELARNIEAVVNISQIIPIGKGGGVVTKPFSKKAVESGVEKAKKSLTDTGRAILSPTGKTTPKETFELTKFFADKVKPTEALDDVVKQFDDVGSTSINKLNKDLAGVTTKFKNKSATDVLKVIKENLEKGIKNKSMPFSTSELKEVNGLLKKATSDGLTLSELNQIKRSINKYTKSWTAAGKDAPGVGPEALRGKYKDVQGFIEFNAKKEGIPNVKELNQDWAKSNTITELLSKQATSVGKKKGIEALQQRGIAGSIGKQVLDLRRTLGLTDIGGVQSLADLDLKKALDAIKEISKKTDKKTFQEFIKGKIKK